MQRLLHAALLVLVVVLVQASGTNTTTSVWNATSKVASAITSTPPLAHAHAHFNSHACGVRDHGKVRSYRLLVTTSDQYLPVLLNWLIFFHDICPDQSSLYFVCLDKGTEGGMKKSGLSCHHTFHMPTTDSKNKLWLLRARLTKTLLDDGHDVLMSDSDAIWLQNPFNVLEQYPESDIIGSRGSFPADAAKMLGATLCMGFVYIKSNDKTRNLWGQLVEYMNREPRPDDQRNLNHLFISHAIAFSDTRLPLPYLSSTLPDTGYVQLTGARQIDLKAKRDVNTTVQITLLPHSQFRRICEKELLSVIHQSHVAHCYSEFKTGTGKRGAESKYGLWALREKWESVVYSGKVDEYYRLISEDAGDVGSAGGVGVIGAPTRVNGSRALLSEEAAMTVRDPRVQHGHRRRRNRYLLCHPERMRGGGGVSAGGVNISASLANLRPVPAWCHERGRAFAANITAADVAAMEGRDKPGAFM